MVGVDLHRPLVQGDDLELARQALERFLGRHGERIYRYLLRLTRDPALAEDGVAVPSACNRDLSVRATSE